MAYKFSQTAGFVIDLEDMAVVPINGDGYRPNQYKAWLAAGNQPQPADPIPPPTLAQELAFTDYQMARACEELIPILISKGVIAKTDLSAALLTNLNNRRKLRGEAVI